MLMAGRIKIDQFAAFQDLDGVADLVAQQRKAFEKAVAEQERAIEDSVQRQDKLLANAHQSRLVGRSTMEEIQKEFQEIRSAAAERERILHAQALAANRRLKLPPIIVKEKNRPLLRRK